MDKICLYLLNRFEFIGNYVFETRNGNLYINNYKLEKIEDFKNKLHSIKISMSLSEFDLLEIDELFDLTVDPNLLTNLYESFKDFFDSDYLSQFMNNDYESKDDLITKIRNLIKNDINDRLDIRTADSLISFIITQKKTYWYTRDLFMYDFSMNLRKINNEWLIEICFKESFINPNYLDLISKIKGRKISNIYLDIYPIEKIDNKLFINNQEFVKIKNYSDKSVAIQTRIYYEDFSIKELLKFEDLIINYEEFYILVEIIDKFMKSGLIDQISKFNWRRLITNLYTNIYNSGQYLKIARDDLRSNYYIDLSINSKYLDMFEIRFNNFDHITDNCEKQKYGFSIGRIHDKKYIDIIIGYGTIRYEWKNKISRLRFKLIDKPIELENIKFNSENHDYLEIGSYSKNYKDLINKFDKFMDRKISFLFIDGVDKLFEIFINKFRIILEIDRMEEILAERSKEEDQLGHNRTVNSRIKLLSDCLSKINIENQIKTVNKYPNEINILIEPDNNLDYVVIHQDYQWIGHIRLVYEFKTANEIIFRIYFDYNHYCNEGYKFTVEINYRFIKDKYRYYFRSLKR